MHHHDGGLLLLALLLIGPPGFFAGRAVLRRSRGPQGRQQRAGGGPLSGWLAHRRALRLERVRHENGTARDKARHEHRLREQAERDKRKAARAAARDPGGPSGDGDWTREATGQGGFPSPHGTGWRATVTHVWGRWHPAGDAARPGREPGPALGPAAPPAPAPGSPGGHRETTGAPGDARSPEPPARGGGSPAPPGRPAPGPASPSPVLTEPRPLEGVIVTMPDTTPGALAVPGVEMIIEGAGALRRHAMSGNARAKRAAVLGIVVASDVLAGIVGALARDMAEPGQHYGTEVTEPLAMSATHFRAGGMTLAEIDGRLAAIIRAAEELRARGVQAPHHEQFQEQ